MRIRDLALLIALLPALVHAVEAPPPDSSTDTFGRLLAKQAQLIESEMDVKIRQNQHQALGVGNAGVTPIPGAKQEVVDDEPTVEAIWGLEGKEVAEISYKGRNVPVSKIEPFISKIDGWKLESIAQYQIVLVRMDGNRVLQRKTVSLNWQGGDTGQPSMPSYAPQPSVITPPIISPLMR